MVDDGSTDGTLTKLHRHENDLPPVHIFSSGFDFFNEPKHMGLARACNVAIAMANGDYLAFIGHDDSWLPNKLESEFAAIERTSADVVYSDFMLELENGNRWKIAGPNFDAQKLKRECFINASSALISKKVIERLDGEPFDEKLYSAMDWDFWIRLSRFAKFHHLPEVLSIYRRHPRQLSRGFRHRFSEWKVYRKYNDDGANYVWEKIIQPYVQRGISYPFKLLGLS